jgi:hypothetical protein
MTTAGPEPDWYFDPDGGEGERYWNGYRVDAAPSISAGRDQRSAENAVTSTYIQKVAGCLGSRNEIPSVQSISWDPPGYSEQTRGSGVIHDANPHLGDTHFLAQRVVGRWDVQIEAC